MAKPENQELVVLTKALYQKTMKINKNNIAAICMTKRGDNSEFTRKIILNLKGRQFWIMMVFIKLHQHIVDSINYKNFYVKFCI